MPRNPSGPSPCTRPRRTATCEENRGSSSPRTTSSTEREAGQGRGRLHDGPLRRTRAVDRTVDPEGRRLDIVIRGGSLLAEWIGAATGRKTSPRSVRRLLAICREYDIKISLGERPAPGCWRTPRTGAQVHELMTLGELTERAWAKDVQVRSKGRPRPRAPDRCQHGPPETALHGRRSRPRPLVTDIAPGYDHTLRHRRRRIAAPLERRRIPWCYLSRSTCGSAGGGRAGRGDRDPDRRPRRGIAPRIPGAMTGTTGWRMRAGRWPGRRRSICRSIRTGRAHWRGGSLPRGGGGLHDVRGPLRHQDVAEGIRKEVDPGNPVVLRGGDITHLFAERFREPLGRRPRSRFGGDGRGAFSDSRAAGRPRSKITSRNRSGSRTAHLSPARAPSPRAGPPPTVSTFRTLPSISPDQPDR